MEIGLFIAVLIFFAGAAWGSFLGVIAMRVPLSRAWIRSRSVCEFCTHALGALDLVPLFSFVGLFGRCRYCGTRLPYFYVAVELATGALFLFGAYQFDQLAPMLIYITVVSFFVLLFITDIRDYCIPDSISLPAIGVVFLANGLYTHAWLSLFFGGVFGAGWFLVQHLVSRGRWVGSGDIRVGALMGVLLGHVFIWLALGIAYVGGSAVALALIAFRRKTIKSTLPFATLLLPAAFVVWLWGEVIWSAYVNFVLGL